MSLSTSPLPMGTRSLRDPALPSPAERPLANPRVDLILGRVRAFPAVVEALAQHGVGLSLGADESVNDLENRVGTGLMALYRDTRAEEVFAALYSFARPAVLVWIQSLLRRGLSHLDAHELLQDTFVNVYRYPGGFRDDHDGSFRVWVRTIAGNIVRRAKSRSRAISFQELPEGYREPADTTLDPEASAVADEQNESLRSSWLLFLTFYRDAYEQLAERDREALRLVEVEGLSYAEAGRLLQVGPSNMKMIIFRSRKRIQARMRAALLSGSLTSMRLAG